MFAMSCYVFAMFCYVVAVLSGRTKPLGVNFQVESMFEIKKCTTLRPEVIIQHPGVQEVRRWFVHIYRSSLNPPGPREKAKYLCFGTRFCSRTKSQGNIHDIVNPISPFEGHYRVNRIFRPPSLKAKPCGNGSCGSYKRLQHGTASLSGLINPWTDK